MPPTLTQRRASFAAVSAAAVATAAGADPASCVSGSGWTARCVWYSERSRLTAVVGAQEERHADIALAHGLAHARGRRLALVLPQGCEHPTLQRLPWITADVTVQTHDHPADPDASHQTSVEHCPPRRKDAAVHLAGGPETTPERHLGPMGELVRPLLEWAAAQEVLSSGHRRDLRAWAHRGQRVLAVTSTRTSVTVRTGIDAGTSPAVRTTFTSPMTAAQLQECIASVEDGIRAAQQQTHGAFEEDHLQELLRGQPHRLGLEQPVLREVPAWRPSGGSSATGRGFIDLVGRDGLGDLVIVETKLAADDMLVLQGLDYWIWAHRPENRDWLHERLHAPAQAALRLLYAVGGRAGTPPVLSTYAKAHLDALDATVHWRLAMLHDWDRALSVVMLSPRQR